MIALLIAIIFTTSLSSTDKEVNNLLHDGNYNQAFNALLEKADNYSNREENLFLLGVISPDGNRSSLYLKEYLQIFPDGNYANQVKRNLLDHYYASGLRITAGKLYSNGADLKDVENNEDLYRIALCKQELGDYLDARRLYVKITLDNNRELRPWAALGVADCDLLNGEAEIAVQQYRSVIDYYPESDAIPFALVGLSEAYRRLNNSDKSKLFYDLYREKYENSPSHEEIEASLLEKRTVGNYRELRSVIDVNYYIQVGVFSKKSNANKCNRKFRNKGEKTRISDFIEGGRKFYRVIVGPLKSESSAKAKKSKLERAEGEAFTILIQ